MHIQFKSNITKIVSQESGQFITSKDMKNSSNNEFHSQFIGILSPNQGSINSNNVNRVAQKLSKDKNVLKISKKRGRNLSKGNENSN